jgi:hypothetical protein
MVKFATGKFNTSFGIEEIGPRVVNIVTGTSSATIPIFSKIRRERERDQSKENLQLKNDLLFTYVEAETKATMKG